LAQGPRRKTGVIVADVRLDGRASRYVAWGDWPAGLCLLCCAGLAGFCTLFSGRHADLE
jgi:apolipoprotein N-acyltransferase